MSLADSVPCGNPTIRIECYYCSVLRNKEVECVIENMLNLYKTEGFCESSDDGKKCGDCQSFSYDMDDCVHNGVIAAVYRFINGIMEDTRKFKPREREMGAIIRKL